MKIIIDEFTHVSGLTAHQRYKKRNPHRNAEIQAKARKLHPDKYRAWGRRCRMKSKYNQYGITAEIAESMKVSQNNLCLIGNHKTEKLCLDHDHKTGRVRGFLCKQHNSLLGFANDSIEQLESAIEYLKRNKS